MRKIDKGIEPQSLTQWKRHHQNSTYNDLPPVERQAIRSNCLEEQFYLCAYCCQSITGENHPTKGGDCINEHVVARNIAPDRSLDFSNIVASCTTLRQCDAAHKSQPFTLTPFMNECETEFKFKMSGRVECLTPRALEAITVLNLGDTEQNNRSLIEKRKQLSQSILWTNGIDPEDGVDGDELINMVIADIEHPIDGKLEAFSPVVVNILRGWLTA